VIKALAASTWVIPENIQNDVVYDPVTGQYIMQSSVGGSFDYRPPMSLSLEEYLNYDMERVHGELLVGPGGAGQ
jgi:hypothetical protein